MKRSISVILSFVLLFYLSGCDKQKNAELQVPINFYYCADPIIYDTEYGVIAPELRDADGYTDDLMHLLEMYLKGPISDHLKSPFPHNVSITQLTQNGDSFYVIFSEEFSELSGLEQTLARACFAKTIIEYTHVESIQFSYEGNATGGRQTVTIKPDSFLFSSETIISTQMQE